MGVPAVWVVVKVARALVWVAKALLAVVVLLLAAALLIRGVIAVVWCVIKHWRTSLSVVVLGALWYWLGWIGTTAVAVGLITTGGMWCWHDRVQFDQLIGSRIRAWWLRWTVYRPKLPRWFARLGLMVQEPDMSSGRGIAARGTGVTRAATGLAGVVGRRPQTRQVLPKVRRVRSGPSWDHVQLKLPDTMTPEQVTEVARPLATACKVERCAIQEIEKNVVSVDFLRRDVLVSTRNPDWDAIIAQDADSIDLHRVPCGLTEYGQTMYTDLASLSELLGGETGAGKGSGMWAPHVWCAPAIASGRVRLMGLDPKGVELAFAQGVFDHYTRKPEKAAELLEWVVDVLIEERQEQIAGVARYVDISWSTPLWVIEFDEMSAWVRYLSDKKLAARIDAACRRILTQGRALGIVLRGYTQSPLKDDLPFRDLIPRRTALRTKTANQTDAILGDGATVAGALAQRITEQEQGMAYRMGEGLRRPQRVRYDFPSDEVLKKFEAYVRAGRSQQYATTSEPQLVEQ